MKVVLPEPEVPTRKTNSPLSISAVDLPQRDSAALVDLGHILEPDHAEGGAPVVGSR